MAGGLALDGWPTWTRWVLGCFALYRFVGCAGSNAWDVIRGITNRETESVVPLVGGACGYAGLALLPVEGAESFKYWPLVLDYGTVVAIIWIPLLMALYVVHEFWAKARRIFERVPDDPPNKPMHFYGQAIESDSESESDTQSER